MAIMHSMAAMDPTNNNRYMKAGLKPKVATNRKSAMTSAISGKIDKIAKIIAEGAKKDVSSLSNKSGTGGVAIPQPIVIKIEKVIHKIDTLTKFKRFEIPKSNVETSVIQKSPLNER